jgi:hypothetical protein
MGDRHGEHPFHEWIVISIADAKDDLERPLLCVMTDWGPPPGLVPYDRVGIEGRLTTENLFDPKHREDDLAVGECRLTRR